MTTKEDMELRIVRLFDEIRNTHIEEPQRKEKIILIQDLSIQYKELTGAYLNVEAARKRVYDPAPDPLKIWRGK